MVKSLVAVSLPALVSECIRGTQSATAFNHFGRTSTGTVIPRRNGGYTLSSNAVGTNCTAIFDDVGPGGTELSPVTCSGEGSGNATMICAVDGSPDRATFGGIGIGSGTLVF